MSWARDGSDLVTWFTGREQLSELWRNHMHAIKCVTTCKPSLAQLNLDSPQHALSNGYRVWGVIMHLGYEGKRSSSGFFRRTAGAAHGDVPLVGSEMCIRDRFKGLLRVLLACLKRLTSPANKQQKEGTQFGSFSICAAQDGKRSRRPCDQTGSFKSSPWWLSLIHI